MLEELFVATRTARREGHGTWNIDNACRWSFFFVDVDRERLIAAGDALARAGYEVGITIGRTQVGVSV